MSDGVKPTRIEEAGYALPDTVTIDGVYTGDDVDFDNDDPGVGAADQWKQPVVAATTASITIATALNNGDTLDGVTLTTGDRVLVKDQGSPEQNGIYIVGATPARSADMDEGLEVLGAVVYVIAGTANTATAWKVTNTAATVVGTDNIAWAAFGGGMSNPMTTQDDIIVGGVSGAPARLAKGTDGQVLTVDPTTHHLLWATPGAAVQTTKGDLAGYSTVPARVPIGTDGYVLTADSAQALGLKWAAAASGSVATDTIWDAKGDLAGGTGANTAARLAVGTNGHVLTADSGEATGMKWAAAAGGSASPVPPVLQSVGQYKNSSSTNALTVTAPTRALIMIVQSETRGASSITQTNVTWTQRYTGNSGGVYVEVWTGAITGAAGTAATVNFASATKSACIFVELDLSALTAVGTAATSTSGVLALTGESDGALVVFAETSFNTNVGYSVANVPFAPIQYGGCLNAGVLYHRDKATTVACVQLGGATRFAAIMRLS